MSTNEAGSNWSWWGNNTMSVTVQVRELTGERCCNENMATFFFFLSFFSHRETFVPWHLIVSKSETMQNIWGTVMGCIYMKIWWLSTSKILRVLKYCSGFWISIMSHFLLLLTSIVSNVTHTEVCGSSTFTQLHFLELLLFQKIALHLYGRML